MSKTLFTAALAFVLSIGGFVLSAQAEETPVDVFIKFKARYDVNLQEGLATLSSTDSQNRQFGYKKNGETGFNSLAQTIADANAALGENSTATFTNVGLGKFQPGDVLQFGYYGGSGDSAVFVPANGDSYTVASDAGFHAGYDIDSFYQLDFSKDPFDGRIEILIMGEPLPASTVTLLIALAAAAAFLLYNNRRTRARISAQA